MPKPEVEDFGCQAFDSKQKTAHAEASTEARLSQFGIRPQEVKVEGIDEECQYSQQPITPIKQATFGMSDSQHQSVPPEEVPLAAQTSKVNPKPSKNAKTAKNTKKGKKLADPVIDKTEEELEQEEEKENVKPAPKSKRAPRGKAKTKKEKLEETLEEEEKVTEVREILTIKPDKRGRKAATKKDKPEHVEPPV